MTYNIYLLTDGKSNYVGSTARELRKRLAEHKYQKRYSEIQYEICEIRLLDVANSNDRFQKENYYIQKYKAINKAKAGYGPVGFIPEQKELNRRSKQMTIWRSKNPEKVEKAKLNSVLNSEKQKTKSKLSHEAKKKLMPKYKAVCKKTGKTFGPYQGHEISKKELNLHESTLIRCLKHGRKNRSYDFELVK